MTTRVRDDAVRDYLLRMAVEEIAALEQRSFALTYPHVAKGLAHPLSLFVLRHVQNFCWTVERFLRHVRRKTMLPTVDLRSLNQNPERSEIGESSETIHFPKVWIDVTNTSRYGFNGGIERVTSELARAAVRTRLALPVIIEQGRLYAYSGQGQRGPVLTFSPEIVYVIADSFWQQADEYRAACEQATAHGAKVVLCMHDVIPLYYPSLSRAAFSRNFAQAFEDLIERCDACIVTSRYSREKVGAAVNDRRLRVGRPLPITEFGLGADGHVGIDLGHVRQRIRDLFARDRVFLSVGTIEPRKGYAVTIDAFDQLWRRQVDCRFVIVGRSGWISQALEQRIREHPLYGDRLHWIEDASDAELTFAYREAYCLVQASITEGFGLPLVEASLEGTPVIATDNEIFRELARNEITYFRTCDSVDLADKIANAVMTRPPVAVLRLLTWEESLAQMVARISDLLVHRQAA